MNLGKIVLSAALAAGLGACATAKPEVKRDCFDRNLTMTCIKEGKDRLTLYNHGSYHKSSTCSTLTKGKYYQYSMLDFGCDGTVDYIAFDLEDVKGYISRKGHEKAFEKNYDPLFKKLRAEALEISGQ